MDQARHCVRYRGYSEGKQNSCLRGPGGLGVDPYSLVSDCGQKDGFLYATDSALCTLVVTYPILTAP